MTHHAIITAKCHETKTSYRPTHRHKRRKWVFSSLLRRGLFVLWGGFCVEAGEKEKESARGTLPIVPRALSIFFDY